MDHSEWGHSEPGVQPFPRAREQEAMGVPLGLISTTPRAPGPSAVGYTEEVGEGCWPWSLEAHVWFQVYTR